ncbi:MAG TPA: hypothetical protein GYA10_08300 [Alphaproteobacteria bacterium]|nr:hypothetical protein [Alphaproteobacteria bacterium]
MPLGLAAASAAFAALGASGQQLAIRPTYEIWQAVPGTPVSDIPEQDVGEIACGTNGGPPSVPLARFEDFAQCPAEASGLHEVYFTYDDEADYIARAMESEFRVVQGGTSVYAHPVIVSVLVGDAGVIEGFRIVTDDRVSLADRRQAATLGRNLKARFSDWSLACTDIEPRPGEKPVGNLFLHEVCTGTSPDGEQVVRFESRFMRKPGQEGLDPETQQPNRGYFESTTRLELLSSRYQPFAVDAP